ncbi:MAG: hypothetical protein ACPGWR_32955, partial [Ardenticatenaceae bacterium]
GGEGLDEVIHFDPYVSNPFSTEAPLPIKVAAPNVVTLNNSLYLVANKGFLVRDFEKRWRDESLPDQLVPPGTSLVANNVHVIFLGGEHEGDLLSHVWQYQALYRNFMPLVPRGE